MREMMGQLSEYYKNKLLKGDIMFEYDELASNAVKTLDKYNLEGEILQCRKIKYLDPYDIREHIEESTNDFELIDALEDLALDEFMEYLTVRYGIRWEEVISYRMI
jgi:hypothetical protein